MKKNNSRGLLLIALGLLGAIVLVLISAAASVFAYRQFVGGEERHVDVVFDGLRLEEHQENDGQGVVILHVAPGSPAEQAGLNPGTLILSVNGRPVNSPQELKDTIGEYKVGDAITLTVEQDGEQNDVAVTLADPGPYLGVNVGPAGDGFHFRGRGFGQMPDGFVMPELPGHPRLPGDPEMPGRMPFEFHFDEFDFDEFGGEHAPFFEMLGQSALVMNVEDGSPAALAGLQARDAITEADGAAVENSQQLIETITALAPGDDVTLQVQRGEETLSIEVTLGGHPEDEERAFLGVLLAPGLMHREMEFFQEERNS